MTTLTPESLETAPLFEERKLNPTPLLTLTEGVDEDEVDHTELPHVLDHHEADHGDKGSRQLHSTSKEDQVEPGEWECEGEQDVAGVAQHDPLLRIHVGRRCELANRVQDAGDQRQDVGEREDQQQDSLPLSRDAGPATGNKSRHARSVSTAKRESGGKGTVNRGEVVTLSV